MKKYLLLYLGIFTTLASCSFITGAQASSLAKVYVHPESSEVCVGNLFSIEVRILNVVALQGFDFCLSYNNKVLDVVGVEEGDFLSSVGMTVIVKNDTIEDYKPGVGLIWFALVVLGDVNANGSGTLAKITFNATVVGESILDLHSINPYKPDEVKLATCSGEHIPNVAVDGYVRIVRDVCPPDDNPPDPPSNPEPNPDINNDGIVNLKDVVVVAFAYGSSIGQPNYDAKADLNQDGEINILDLYIIAENFGRKYP